MLNLVGRISSIKDTANANEWNTRLQEPSESLENERGFVTHGSAAQATSLIRQRMSRNNFAIDRGVGGDDSIKVDFVDHTGQRFDLKIVQVRGDLDEQWHYFAIFCLERSLLCL